MIFYITVKCKNGKTKMISSEQIQSILKAYNGTTYVFFESEQGIVVEVEGKK